MEELQGSLVLPGSQEEGELHPQHRAVRDALKTAVTFQCVSESFHLLYGSTYHRHRVFQCGTVFHCMHMPQFDEHLGCFILSLYNQQCESKHSRTDIFVPLWKCTREPAPLGVHCPQRTRKRGEEERQVGVTFSCPSPPSCCCSSLITFKSLGATRQSCHG